MDRMLDLESGTIHELNKPVPGMWRIPTNLDLCCIYRVPNCLRHVNPEAYTPQLVILGPLHHSLKAQALMSRGDIKDTKSIGYLNMEEHKKFYLAEFTKRVEGKRTVDGFRRMIEEEEEMIRASYSESTDWIKSPEFVEMILHDSVFILEFILRNLAKRHEKIGDPLMDEPCLLITIVRDLILLENQIPYFILEKLFDPIVPILRLNQTFRELIIKHFAFQDKIENNSKFRHFTDLFRCVRVKTLPKHGVGKFNHITLMYNADKLHSGGVKFKAIEGKFSLHVSFDLKNGCLMMPRFLADGKAETTLRNIMALEQCHYPFHTHVCNYVLFLHFLIDTQKDVELLVEKDIASQVIEHYDDKCNKSHAILKNVYFSHLWRGTATVAATLLLLMTLTQTAISVIQIFPNNTPP